MTVLQDGGDPLGDLYVQTFGLDVAGASFRVDTARSSGKELWPRLAFCPAAVMGVGAEGGAGAAAWG